MKKIYYYDNQEKQRKELPLIPEEYLKEVLNVLYWDCETLTIDDKLKDLNSSWYIYRFNKKHHMLGYLVFEKYKIYFPNTMEDLLDLTEILNKHCILIDFYTMKENIDKIEKDKLPLDYSLSYKLGKIESTLQNNYHLKNTDKDYNEFFTYIEADTRSKLIKDNQGFGLPAIKELFKIYDKEWLKDLFENYVFLFYRHIPEAYYFIQNVEKFYSEKLLETLEEGKNKVLKDNLYNFIAKTNYPENADSEGKFTSITGTYDNLKDYDNFYKVIKNRKLRTEVKKWLQDNREIIKPFLTENS